eukprot:3331425-Amphidinium_carterae.1
MTAQVGKSAPECSVSMNPNHLPSVSYSGFVPVSTCVSLHYVDELRKMAANDQWRRGSVPRGCR